MEVSEEFLKELARLRVKAEGFDKICVILNKDAGILNMMEDIIGIIEEVIEE